MTRMRRWCLAMIPALVFGLPLVLAAAEPERLPQKPFDVKADASGTLEVTFALTLSEVPSYNVTITAVSGSIEEQLWTGNLDEGIYLLRAPLTQVPRAVGTPLKVICKTTMIDRGAQFEKRELDPATNTMKRTMVSAGDVRSVVYRTWEGTIGR